MLERSRISDDVRETKISDAGEIEGKYKMLGYNNTAIIL